MANETREARLARTVEAAQDAFWAVVQGEYQAQFGDFGPEDTFAFDAACKRAVEVWTDDNVYGEGAT